jgi:hypothetical protein
VSGALSAEVVEEKEGEEEESMKGHAPRVSDGILTVSRENSIRAFPSLIKTMRSFFKLLSSFPCFDGERLFGKTRSGDFWQATKRRIKEIPQTVMDRPEIEFTLRARRHHYTLRSLRARTLPFHGRPPLYALMRNWEIIV